MRSDRESTARLVREGPGVYAFREFSRELRVSDASGRVVGVVCVCEASLYNLPAGS